jgi:hypothetical protein
LAGQRTCADIKRGELRDNDVSMRGAGNEDQRNCRSDVRQYGLVSQRLVCAFGYAMRRSSRMRVQGLSSAIIHAP